LEEFFNIITNFGFPIALSSYLLLRFEKILSGLQTVIAALVEETKRETEEIKELKLEIKNFKRRENRRTK